MAATIAKWGNSLAVRIPQNLVKEMGLIEGSEVELASVDRNLVIKPVARRRYSITELTQTITPKNLHSETDYGTAMGNEVW
jgi:antitoxin MazE